MKLAPITLGVGIGLLLAGVLGACAAPLALLHRDPSALETAYGNAMVTLVARVSSGGLGPNPVAAEPEAMQAARSAYTGSCSQCHGAAGDGLGVFGRASFPPATDLTKSPASDLTDPQLFVVIKNGLGFTAMPAYRDQYSDEQIWALVTFLRTLQNGTAIHLAVVAPTAQQLARANLQAGGDARSGAEVFAAQSCGTCHQPAGALSIDPRSPRVSDAVRKGRLGMPCYPVEQLPETELQNLLAYLATFPSGQLGNDPVPDGFAAPLSPCAPRG